VAWCTCPKMEMLCLRGKQFSLDQLHAEALRSGVCWVQQFIEQQTAWVQWHLPPPWLRHRLSFEESAIDGDLDGVPDPFSLILAGLSRAAVMQMEPPLWAVLRGIAGFEATSKLCSRAGI
jgi:hypothetical protein